MGVHLHAELDDVAAGDQQHCGERSKINEEEVLERAKVAIMEADFVGFYESLDSDFWRLKDAIFPHVKLPYYIPFAFWIGTWLSVPRLRVLKFSQYLSAKELEVIRAANKLDMELYKWAVRHYNPRLVLYANYGEFFFAHGFLFVAAAFMFAACCLRAWRIRGIPDAKNMQTADSKPTATAKSAATTPSETVGRTFQMPDDGVAMEDQNELGYPI